MKKPLISVFRKKLGLSQKQLAQAAGTSQQQIQRIESSRQAARLDLATKICSVLKAPMEVVFPETREILKKVQQRVREEKSLIGDPEVELEMEEAGVEVDPREWVFKYRLRGGLNGSFLIQKKEQRRLWSLVQRNETCDSPFVVFTSRGMRIALNLDHLLFCHFLFEAFSTDKEEEQELDEVKVFFADGSEPLSFDPQWEGDSEDSDECGDLSHLLYMAEMLDSDDVNHVFHFTDSDGETTFLRAKDIAMIQIPESIFQDDDEEAQSQDPNTALKGTA